MSSSTYSALPGRTVTTRTVLTTSSVESIERTILKGPLFRDESKEKDWMSFSEELDSCIERNYDNPNKVNRRNELILVLNKFIRQFKIKGAKTDNEKIEALFIYFSEYFRSDRKVMDHLNEYFYREYLYTLTQWRSISDQYDRMSSFKDCIFNFRLKCRNYPLVEDYYDCETCNPFVEKPKGIAMNEGPFWVTSRFKLKIDSCLQKFEEICDDKYRDCLRHFSVREDFFVIPQELNELVGFNGISITYEGALEIKVKPFEPFKSIKNVTEVGTFYLNCEGKETSYGLDNNNGFYFKQLLTMLCYYKQSDEQSRQRGCIESLIKAGPDHIIFAHSLGVEEMFMRAREMKGFHLCSLSELGDISLIFGSEIFEFDMSNALYQDLKRYIDFDKNKNINEFKLGLIVSRFYGLNGDDVPYNILNLVGNKITRTKDIRGLANKASKKFIFEYSTLSERILGVKKFSFQKLNMSKGLDSICIEDLKNFKVKFVNASSKEEVLEILENNRAHKNKQEIKDGTSSPSKTAEEDDSAKRAKLKMKDFLGRISAEPFLESNRKFLSPKRLYEISLLSQKELLDSESFFLREPSKFRALLRESEMEVRLAKEVAERDQQEFESLLDYVDGEVKGILRLIEQKVSPVGGGSGSGKKPLDSVSSVFSEYNKIPTQVRSFFSSINNEVLVKYKESYPHYRAFFKKGRRGKKGKRNSAGGQEPFTFKSKKPRTDYDISFRIAATQLFNGVWYSTGGLSKNNTKKKIYKIMKSKLFGSQTGGKSKKCKRGAEPKPSLDIKYSNEDILNVLCMMHLVEINRGRNKDPNVKKVLISFTKAIGLEREFKESEKVEWRETVKAYKEVDNF